MVCGLQSMQYRQMVDFWARQGRAVRVGIVVAAALVVGIGVGESLGWPFLAEPIQQTLEGALQRRVRLGVDASAPPVADIRLLGGLRIRAPHIEIGAPAWSQSPYTFAADKAQLTLAYADLWRAYRGQPLRVRDLRADSVDLRLERLADGRASWQFGEAGAMPADGAAIRLPRFDVLQISAGVVSVRDALQAIDAEADFSLLEESTASSAGLQMHAHGSYRKLPLKVDLFATGAVDAVALGGSAPPVPVSLEAHVGHTHLVFRGTATDAVHLDTLKGAFTLSGPSLAAVGEPLGVTLPTTAPFATSGELAKTGDVWNVVATKIAVGSSRLAGAFTYDPRPAVPMLMGRLTGARLLLSDLGPALGVPVVGASEAAASASASAGPKHSHPRGRVLPDRPFDLHALRVMNANVLVDISSVDLGSHVIQPLAPLHTHMVLNGGVLAWRNLDARTAQGRLSGNLELDGRTALALWTADLHWNGVHLESWIHQVRANGAAPYLSGVLNGQARVAGEGTSTASILGSLHGGVRMQVAGGHISHLAVEAVGLDVANGLGVLIKGDDSLPIRCLVTDMVADKGVLRPRMLVLDTAESTMWLDGTLSLATEALDMQVHVAPKDFSPLALRTPIHLTGTFAAPVVSVDKAGIGARLGAAVLLGVVAPWAALIPLLDFPSADAAAEGPAGCAQLSRRINARKPLAASNAAKSPGALPRE